MTDVFITATDTDAGKTYVARALAQALVNQQRKVAVYKPISAGCEQVGDTLINEDARLLADIANSGQSIAEVNPIAFKEPIAPHIAAAKTNTEISIRDIELGFAKVKELEAEFNITEGAGGWRLPLGGGKFLSDFVVNTQQQVVLVVNMKLGCLNHAILTYQAVLADGLDCVAWVANCPEQMPYLEENIAELKRFFPMPLVARLGYSDNIQDAALAFDLSVF